MITSRSQYIHTQPPDGIRIDGGIIPARDAACETVGVLRGEDIAFIGEAVGQLMLVLEEEHDAVGAGHSVDAAAYNRAAYAIRRMSDSNRLANVDATGPSGTRYDYGMDDVLAALGSAEEATAANTPDVSGGSPLDADSVRLLHYRLTRLRALKTDAIMPERNTLAHRPFETDSVGYMAGMSFEELYGMTEEAYQEQMNADRIVYRYRMDRANVNTDGQGSAVTTYYGCLLRASTTNGIAYYQSGLAAERLAAVDDKVEMWLTLGYAYHFSPAEAVDLEIEERSGVFTVPVRGVSIRQNGWLPVDFGTIVQAVAEAIDHYGLTEYGLHDTSASFCELTFGLRGVVARVRLNDHCDISSIGWTWQPPT